MCCVIISSNKGIFNAYMYTSNITFEEVKNIYKSIGVDISESVLRKK